MKQYTAAEARTRFAEILNLVEAGETIEITKHGEPVAVIVQKRPPTRMAKPGFGLKEGWSYEMHDFSKIPEGWEF
jgi:prevent-host-death family protein